MRERPPGLLESLLLSVVRTLLPARGRHRAATTQLPVKEQPLAPALIRPLDAWPFEPDTHLVRPYLGVEVSA